MNVEQQGDTYTITPNARNNGRVKGSLIILGGYYSLPGIITAVTALGVLVNIESFVLAIPTVVMLGGGVAMIIAGARAANKATEQERIIISPESFAIESGSKTIIYPIAEIYGIHYTGYAVITDHPLKTGGFDYMGFETRDKEIARIHDEGHLKLYAGDKQYYFGKELASWDAKAISDILVKVTDGRLYIQNLPDEIPEDVYMAGGPAQL